MQETNSQGLVLIIIGSGLSFGRYFLAKYYVQLHGWLRKQPPDERLLPAVRLSLMMTGMIFTVAGLLALFGIILK